MFEDNKYDEFDLMVRSVLDEAQEEVPAGVWEGISAGLDKAAGRKVVALRWRRAAVGLSAAAAVAAGLLINRGDGDFVPAAVSEDMIAVVEEAGPAAPEERMTARVIDLQDREADKGIVLTADHGRHPEKGAGTEEVAAVSEAKVSEEKPAEGKLPERNPAEDVPADKNASDMMEEDNLTYKNIYESDSWIEEKDRDGRRFETSLVLSGIAGTNGTQTGKGNVGYIRQPSISTAPLQTGIKETSTKSTYGIPLSFGAGVKMDFTPRWSLGVGINYTLLTRRFYGKYTKVDGDGAAEIQISTDIRNSQHYVGIPVNAFYNIVDSRHLNFYTYFGGTVERCIADKYQLLGKDIVHTEKAKGVQLSANIGIGVEFLIGDYLGIYVDPSLRYYFDNGQPSSIRTAQPLMLGFEMGLRVKL